MINNFKMKDIMYIAAFMAAAGIAQAGESLTHLPTEAPTGKALSSSELQGEASQKSRFQKFTEAAKKSRIGQAVQAVTDKARKKGEKTCKTLLETAQERADTARKDARQYKGQKFENQMLALMTVGEEESKAEMKQREAMIKDLEKEKKDALKKSEQMQTQLSIIKKLCPDSANAQGKKAN